MRVLLERHYGYLFEPELLDEIEAAGKCKLIKQGERLLDIGQDITVMPLIFGGAIKILREDDDGDELLLYFIEKGDTCAMTFSCCLGSGKSEIRAIAESDTELLMIPISKMDEWMAKYQSWREFILDSYHTRMSELLETIDTLAFMKMDERVYKYLIDKVKLSASTNLDIKHNDVAEDLNTSRVVISRILKQLENEKKIKLSRNKIEVLDF